MICSLVVATVGVAKVYRLLFLGNSHTSNHNIPNQVAQIVERGESRPRVIVRSEIGGFLDDLAARQDVVNSIRGGKWTHLILQGQKLSSSHKYEYSKGAAISLANLGKRFGAKALLFVEWSRKGIKESDFQIRGYRQIAAPTGATIVPICWAFDLAIKKDKKFELWSADGNHSSALGAYLASCTIANAISPLGEKPIAVPNGVSAKVARLMWSCAKQTKALAN